MIDNFTQKYNFIKSDIITYVIIWLLISLPFSAIKGGIADPTFGYPNVIIFNRTLFVLIGVLLIYIGNRQSKKTDIDLNALPIMKPTTKIILGGAIIFIGVIQLFPLLK